MQLKETSFVDVLNRRVIIYSLRFSLTPVQRCGSQIGLWLTLGTEKDFTYLLTYSLLRHLHDPVARDPIFWHMSLLLLLLLLHYITLLLFCLFLMYLMYDLHNKY